MQHTAVPQYQHYSFVHALPTAAANIRILHSVLYVLYAPADLCNRRQKSAAAVQE
jgi:hypothetical protein